MKYRKEIDGLRAIAVLSVIFFHAGITGFGGGFVGVDIFFVISGFLITSIIFLELKQDSFSLVNFYERRARRILPALFFMMICALPFAWFWMLPRDFKSFSQSLVAVPLFASNILFYLTSGYFDTASELKPLLHTWSLAVEEQYYILFPFLFVLLWKRSKKFIIYSFLIFALISLIVAQWITLKKPSFSFYLLPTRGFEILIGVLTSLYMNYKPELELYNQHAPPQLIKQSASLIGLMLIIYSIIAFSTNTPSPSLHTLIPTFGASLILIFANDKTHVGNLLGSKIFVGIGLISYSTYLWHQPLFSFARLRSIGEPSNMVLYLLIIFSLIMGYVSWKCVETPFRNKRLISRNNLIIYSVISSSLFVLIGLIGHLTKGYPSRVPSNVSAIAFGAEDKNPRQEECHLGAETFPTPPNSCVLGNKNKLIGVLLGDSHADAISFPLENRLASNQLGFLSLTYGGCPPIKNIYRVDTPISHKCFEYNNQTFSYLLENPNIHYIVLSARWTLYLEKTRFNNKEGGAEDGGVAFIDVIDNNGQRMLNAESKRKYLVKKMYQKTIKDLLSSDKKVILIYPVPETGWDVPIVLAKTLLFNGGEMPALTTSYEVYKERNAEAIDAFDSIPNNKNLIRIKPDKILCDTFVANRCITHIGSSSIYYDDDHLSKAGAKLVVDEIMNFIK